MEEEWDSVAVEDVTEDVVQIAAVLATLAKNSLSQDDLMSMTLSNVLKVIEWLFVHSSMNGNVTGKIVALQRMKMLHDGDVPDDVISIIVEIVIARDCPNQL